jgi:hypothetical protein
MPLIRIDAIVVVNNSDAGSRQGCPPLSAPLGYLRTPGSFAAGSQ